MLDLASVGLFAAGSSFGQPSQFSSTLPPPPPNNNK